MNGIAGVEDDLVLFVGILPGIGQREDFPQFFLGNSTENVIG